MSLCGCCRWRPRDAWLTRLRKGAEEITDEHYRYVGEDVNQIRELLEDLKELVAEQGPFDGLLGFSEGGGIAAFLLIEDARRPFGNFRCAVFFSSAAPFDPDALLDQGKVRWIEAQPDGALINVPTAHMWSDVDDVSETSAKVVASLSAAHVREIFVHKLGHDVPGAKGNEGLDLAIRAIDRTIERARA